jgi:hypothetical protein
MSLMLESHRSVEAPTQDSLAAACPQLRDRMGGDAIPPQPAGFFLMRVLRCVDFSQGIPLYVTEICMWLRNRVKIDSDGIMRLGSTVSVGGLVPPSVHSLVQTHIDNIPADLQLLLRCASVIGTAFEEALLLEVVQQEIPTTAGTLQQHLHRLRELQLITLTQGGHWEVCVAGGYFHFADDLR